MAQTKSSSKDSPSSKKTLTSVPARSQSPPPPPKKVRITEPLEEGSKTPLVKKPRSARSKPILISKEKGKVPLISSSQPEVSQHSESETQRMSKRKMKAQKPTTISPQGSEQPSIEVPRHFNTKSVNINSPGIYSNQYQLRSLCPAMYVDLEYLKNSLKIDLTDYLGHYQNLLKIDTSFSPDMVRIFYNNMKSDSATDANGNIILYSLFSTIRGAKISITADLINSYLGTHEFESELRNFSPEEIHKLLKPGEPVKALNFEPSSMPPLQRIIHYIYSRCLVNKSKNFTHLATGDYHLLASIMAKEKRNIGQLVFNEIWKFKHTTSKRMSIPYPCLISRILEQHNIWYIMQDQKPVKPIKFSEIHLHRMKIEYHLSPRKGLTDSKRKKKTPSGPSQAHQDEAQSSAPQHSVSVPSFTQNSVQHLLQAEFKRMSEEFSATFQREIRSYTTHLLRMSNEYFSGKTLESEFRKLATSVNSRISALENKVISLEAFIRSGQFSGSSSSSVLNMVTEPPLAEPSSDPTFTPSGPVPSSIQHPL